MHFGSGRLSSDWNRSLRVISALFLGTVWPEGVGSEIAGAPGELRKQELGWFSLFDQAGKFLEAGGGSFRGQDER